MPADGPQNTRAKQLKRVKKRAPSSSVPTYHPSTGDTKGASDLKRGEPFKRSRTYYADYNAALLKNPKVKKAVKTLKHEVKKGHYQSKTYNKAGDALEKERRHGPDTVAESAYRPYTSRLWKRVKKDYPKGKKPGLKVSGASKGQAFAWADHDTVYVDPETIRAYMQPDDTQARRFAEGAPLHEWTHLRQRTGLPQPLAEGGAEAHAVDVSKKHHVRYDRVPQYKPYVRYVRRRKGFVKKGQYKTGGG